MFELRADAVMGLLSSYFVSRLFMVRNCFCYLGSPDVGSLPICYVFSVQKIRKKLTKQNEHKHNTQFYRVFKNGCVSRETANTNKRNMIKKSSVFFIKSNCVSTARLRVIDISPHIELLIFITVSDAIVRWRKLC